jgi:hypothetical protein
MADHSKPLLTSAYSSFVSELDARLDDITMGLEAATTTPTALPTGAIRWNSASRFWQKWSGSAWTDLTTAQTYAISVTGNAGTVTNGVVTTGSYSDPSWITGLAGSKISGDIAGKAGTATTLATARTINGVSFNGSANIDVNTVQSLTVNNSGSGVASGTTFNGSVARVISYNSVGAPKADGTSATGTWPISVTGAATSATSASNVATANFTIEQSGTDLVIRYNAATIFKITSAGELVAKDNITAYGAP